MNLEKKRAFIINVLYVGLILALVFAGLKYALPLLAPFVLALAIAYLLNRPIRFASRRLGMKRKSVAILAVLLFYCTIGLLITLVCIKVFSAAGGLIETLPGFYTERIEPGLMSLMDAVNQSVLSLDPSLLSAIEQLWEQFVSSLGQIISSLSSGMVSVLSSAAGSLPGLVVKLLLMIIATFFITVDYERITAFILRQMSARAQQVFWQVKNYVTGTLFGCIRSYALIMFITFTELSVGLSIIGVEGAVMIALSIAVFDILPVLGTGGIMIPWIVICAIQGDYHRAAALAIVYVIVTIVRNIIEPRIVGKQIGLHPIVTLASIFIGAQLFGAVGLFGLPITLSLLCYLNEQGTIHLFK